MPGSRQRSMHSTSAHAGNPRPESADSIETGDYEACDHNDESRLQRKGTLVGPCLGKHQRFGAERRINHQKARIHHYNLFTFAHHFGEIRKIDTHCVYRHAYARMIGDITVYIRHQTGCGTHDELMVPCLNMKFMLLASLGIHTHAQTHAYTHMHARRYAYSDVIRQGRRYL